MKSLNFLEYYLSLFLCELKSVSSVVSSEVLMGSFIMNCTINHVELGYV